MSARFALVLAALAFAPGCLINQNLFDERWEELPPECGDEDYEPPDDEPDPCEEEQSA